MMTVKFASLLKRIRRAFRLLRCGQLDLLIYEARNRMKGLDLGFVALKTLGLSRESSESHSNSGGPNLARVLKKLQIPRTSSALDLGSGKGGALFTLSGFPFAEIVGVEISPELARIAEANLARLRLRNVHFIRADAARFTDLDRFTHVYMFNPFPGAIVKRVLENLAVSLERAPRCLTLIYNNPVCHETIMASGLFSMDQEFSFRNGGDAVFRVYTHRSGCDSVQGGLAPTTQRKAG